MVKITKQRPRRIFYDEKTKRYFYLINKKKKYIKAPKDIQPKEIARINIKNILPVQVRRKAIRPRETIKPITNQQVVSKFVPIAPVSQNLSEKYSLYQAKDDLTKKFTKLDETLKAVDTAKGKYATQNNPPKIQTLNDYVKGREESENQLLSDMAKQTEEANAKAQLRNTTAGFTTTNPDPEVEDEGDISTEPTGILGKVGQLFTGKQPKKPKKTNYTENEIIELAKSYSAYNTSFPPYEWVINEVRKLSNRRDPGRNIYQRAKDKYVPPNTTAIGDLKSEEDPANISLERTIGTGISTFYKLNGLGDYENDDDGIFNDELQEIFKDKMNKFLPVIASDKMHTLLPLVNRDIKKFGWIQNTEPQKSGGRHWVAYFIDIPNMEVNYYDSLVENDGIPPKESMKGLKKIIDKIHPEYYLKFKYNTIRDQNPSSKNCGYFALKFVMDRYRNVPFKSASGYDKVYEDYGSGEEMIKRFKKYL